MAEQLTKEQFEAVKAAKGSAWKKILWWIAGVAGLIGVVLVIACLLKRKGPVQSAQDIIQTVNANVRLIDAEAKAKAAAAAGAEAATVKVVREIAAVKDDYERSKRLADLVKEDY